MVGKRQYLNNYIAYSGISFSHTLELTSLHTRYLSEESLNNKSEFFHSFSNFLYLNSERSATWKKE